MDFVFKLHILKDVVQYIDVSKIPDNICIETVDVIDINCMELDKEIYDRK